MGTSDRYEACGAEAEFEPGSRGRVLRNLVGVRSLREMQRLEAECLLAATEEAIAETRDDQRFDATDLCRWHRDWLGGLYVWAGEYRQVNLTKGELMFAAAEQVPRLMEELDRGPLREFTPCHPAEPATVARALGVVHAELVLIHPFRPEERGCPRSRRSWRPTPEPPGAAPRPSASTDSLQGACDS